MDNQNYQMQRYGYGPPGRGRPHWQNDNSHLIPMPSRGRGRGGPPRGRGRGRGGPRYGQYQAFHYRSKNPRQQAPVEHYFKTDMLDDPWKDCKPVQVSEVTKKQAQNTRHRYRLFARLDQEGDENLAPDGKRIKKEGEAGQPGTAAPAENPDEIEIEDSSDEETDKKKPKKEENKTGEEPEEEEEEELCLKFLILNPYLKE